METKLKLIIRCIFIASFVLNFSCNEDEFLKEVPLDFYSPENSYITYDNYQAVLTDLYARIRSNYDLDINALNDVNFLGTDIAYNARLNYDRIGNYNSSIIPEGSLPKREWVNWYKIITNANTIISRLPDSELTESEMKEVQAEAKLFRAWSYRHLVYLFGGVPLVLEEVTSPKSDYTRTSKNDILNQIVIDASEAAENLSGPNDVIDGKLSNAVANHLLAETYIALEEYEKAVASATKVINNSGLSLMTDRFGSLKNEPGDVYFDLFRVNNQNRGQGNTEAIWVAQLELDVPGGLLESDNSYHNCLERCIASAPWSIKDPDGFATTYKGKQISSFNCGGRGVSFIRPSDYYLYDIWGLDPGDDNRIVDNSDIRTSKYNIVRDFIYSNPESTNYYGKSLIDFPSPQWLEQDWRWYPYPTKITTAGQHPEGVIDDPEHMTLKTTAGSTYRDMYIIRLPETYFLRAEAYLLKGEKQKAADDLNVVRARANATPVTADEVDLDYILDERARELIFEEKRRITLSRMEVLVERVRKYNPLNADNINDYNDLFPIPYSEIEANKDVILEQNPGYN
jgi:hypothetical protein